MAAKPHKAYGYDQLWKNIIEDFFPDFIHYFMPTLVPIINFSVPPEFLDQQLKSLFPEKGRNRYVDKLVKVALLDGTYQYLYIHIEVQGYPDSAFNWRMFQCHYRILDNFNGQIAVETIAVLTDDDPKFRPGQFEKSGRMTKTFYEFETFKLIDHTPEALLQGKNPFGVIMQTAWYHLQVKDQGDAAIFATKLQLVNRLRALGLTREQTSKLVRFIKDYTKFETQKNYSKFDVELSKDEETKKAMGLFELAKDEGRVEGHQLGLEEGRQEGRQEGLKTGRGEGILIGEARKSDQLIAKALQSSKLSVAEVADLFDKTIAYVENLKAQLGQGNS